MRWGFQVPCLIIIIPLLSHEYPTDYIPIIESSKTAAKLFWKLCFFKIKQYVFVNVFVFLMKIMIWQNAWKQLMICFMFFHLFVHLFYDYFMIVFMVF